MASKRSSLPAITSKLPGDLRKFLDRLREIHQGANRVLTTDDMVDTGEFKGTSTGGVTPTTDSGADCIRPPAPVDFTSTGSMTSIILEWGGTGYGPNCHSTTEIWRSNTDDISTAIQVGSSKSELYSDAVGSEASVFYWIRFINKANESGPFNATAGTAGETAPDLSYLMQMLSDTYGGSSEAPFFQIDEATEINGVEIPAGTYMKSAFIYEAFIQTAQIADAAIESAKIANAAIVNAKIAVAAIESANIKNLAVQTAHIALLAVTDALIANATITSAKIVSLDADKVNAVTLSSIVANIGTVNAGKLQSTDGFMVIDLDNKFIYIK